MEQLKSVVFELEDLVCEFCDVDRSNCSYCLVREKVVEILENNNIQAKDIY